MSDKMALPKILDIEENNLINETKDNAYIVYGAELTCNRRDYYFTEVRLVALYRGANTGFEIVIMHIDRREDNFISNFGTCKKTKNPCVFSNVAVVWEDPNTTLGHITLKPTSEQIGTEFSLEPIYPLTKDSTLACYEGEGLIRIDKNGQSRSSSEWNFGISHPYLALVAIGTATTGKGDTNISTNAARFAAGLGLQENDAAEGSEVNAFRHTFWVSVIKNNYGRHTAYFASNSHEDELTLKTGQAMSWYLGEENLENINLPNLARADGVADYFNNNIALNRVFPEGTSQKEIAMGILNEFHDSGLWVVEENEGSFNVVKRQLDDDSYNSALEDLNNMDSNGFPPGNVHYKGD